MRLAGQFKLAEQHASNGVPKGDEIFTSLLEQAHVLVFKHTTTYPHYDAIVEIPALRDLELLATPEKKQSPWAMIAAIIVGTLAVAYTGGILVGIANMGFHLLGR